MKFLVSQKYQPISLKRWGDDHYVYDIHETESQIDIFLKSNIHKCQCPDCGVNSDSRHSTYDRVLQDVPFRDFKTTYLHVRAFTYDCINPECKTKTFTEPLPFAHGCQQRTDALDTTIIAVAATVSDNGAACTLNDLGIKIHYKTIKRLRNKIEFIDDPDVKFVGIDDIATRKGYKYATVVYDMENHVPIAFLDGRDAETLKEWLSSHTKIQRITRDGAAAYAKAIREILPECIQVSDRFHLLHNLFEKLRKIFNQSVPKEIVIKSGKVIEDEEEDIPVIYDNSPATDIEGNAIQFDNHGSIDLNQEERRQAERVKKKR